MKKRFQETAVTAMDVIPATISTACGSSGRASADGEDGQPDTDGGAMTEESSAGAPEDKKEKIELTGMIQQSRWYFRLQKMVEKLETDEDIIIKFKVIPDDQYDNLIGMRLNPHEAPDLVAYQFADLFATANPEEFSIPMDGEAWMPDVIVPKLTEYNGKHYGYCFKAFNGFQGLAYNEDVSTEHGTTGPPKTLKKFYGIYDRLKEEGVAPIAILSDTWVPQIWMTSGMARVPGTNEANEESTKKIPTNQAELNGYSEMVAVIDKYLDLFKEGYISEDFMTVNYDETLERLAGSEIAMIYGATEILTSIEESYPDSNFTIFNPPVDYNEKDVLVYLPTAMGIAINKDTEKLDTTKEILEVWSTPEYSNLYFESHPGFPNIKGIDGNESAMNPDISKTYPECMEGGRAVAQMNQYIDTLQPLFDSTLWVYLLEVPSKGSTDGTVVLDRFQEDMEKFMTEKDARDWEQENAAGGKG